MAGYCFQQNIFVPERSGGKEKKMKIITCEQVSCGHPDKLADQIADAVVTDVLKHDKNGRVAIEVLLKDNHIIIAGELRSTHNPDYRKLVFDVFERIGWEKLNYGDPVFYGQSISDIREKPKNKNLFFQLLIFWPLKNPKSRGTCNSFPEAGGPINHLHRF